MEMHKKKTKRNNIILKLAWLLWLGGFAFLSSFLPKISTVSMY